MLTLIHSQREDQFETDYASHGKDLCMVYCDLEGREKIYKLGSTIEMMREKMSLQALWAANGKEVEAKHLYVRNIGPYATLIEDVEPALAAAVERPEVAKIMLDFFLDDPITD